MSSTTQSFRLCCAVHVLLCVCCFVLLLVLHAEDIMTPRELASAEAKDFDPLISSSGQRAFLRKVISETACEFCRRQVQIAMLQWGGGRSVMGRVHALAG